MNSNWYKAFMKLTGVAYGKELLLKGVPVIYNARGATLRIGTNVRINSSFLSNLVGLYARTIIVTRCQGAEIIIGDNAGISGATIYARSAIEIGDNTLVGGNVKILDNDFHPLEAEARNAHREDAIAAMPIRIGKNCFIGCNALILKGTKLGDGCAVGAGAVVSGVFAPGSVVAGNPARLIRAL